MYIAFEGGEGAGKTTQIMQLATDLMTLGFEVLALREPGGNEISNAIRSVILNPGHTRMSSITEILLFTASRAQNVDEVIEPALKRGVVVVSDRTFYSMYAYQGYGRGENLAWLKEITEWAVSGVTPDLVILLDIPPQVGVARKFKQGELNRLDVEFLDFHERVRVGYLALSRRDPDKWLVVDATLSVEEIYREVFAFVLLHLLKQNVT